MLASLLNAVDADVPRKPRIYILSFRGNHPILAQTVNYSQISPFMVLRQLTDPSVFPVYAGTDEEALKFLCSTYDYYVLGKGTMAIPRSSIEDYYSWEVTQDNSVRNSTVSERERLGMIAKTRNCTFVSALSGTGP